MVVCIDVMTKETEVLRRDDTVSSAIEKMQELHVRHLPVVAQDNKLIGMVSDRDVLRILPVPKQRSEEPEIRFRDTLFAAADKAVLHERVDAVMNKETHAVHPDVLLTDALALFQARGVSGLPVVDPRDQNLCGILTTSDVLRVFRVVMQIGLLTGRSSTDTAVSADPARIPAAAAV